MSSRRSCRTGHRSDNRLPPSLSRVTPSAASEHVSELLGYPISRSLTACCVCLEPRPLPSTGITRLQRYCEPLRHPSAPGLSLTGVWLIIPDHALGFPVLRALSLCTCCRHYPGAAAGRTLRSSHPAVSAFPGRVTGSACTSSFSRLARRSLALRPAHSRGHQFVTRYPKASDISSSPCLLRLLPAGAVVGWGLHQLESAALSRRTPTPVIDPGSGNASAPEPEFGSRVTTNVTRAGIAPKCRTLALCAIDRTSGRCARTRVSADHLRRLPEGAQKGAAHAVAIG